MNQITEGFLDSIMEFCEAVGIKICELKGVKPPPSLTDGKKKAPCPAATETESTNKNNTHIYERPLFTGAKKG